MNRSGIILRAAGVLALAGIAISYSRSRHPATVTVSWSYDYTRQPACSDPDAKNCIDHFEIWDYTDQLNPTFLRKVSNPPNAVGKVDHISEQFSYGPPAGRRTIVVIAVARDKDGALSKSNPFAARKEVEFK